MPSTIEAAADQQVEHGRHSAAARLPVCRAVLAVNRMPTADPTGPVRRPRSRDDPDRRRERDRRPRSRSASWRRSGAPRCGSCSRRCVLGVVHAARPPRARVRRRTSRDRALRPLQLRPDVCVPVHGIARRAGRHDRRVHHGARAPVDAAARGRTTDRALPVAGLAGALIAAAGIAVIFSNQVSLNVPVLALVALVLAAPCIAETSVLVKRFPPGDPIVREHARDADRRRRCSSSSRCSSANRGVLPARTPSRGSRSRIS